MELSDLMDSIRFQPVDLMELSQVNFRQSKFIDPYFPPNLYSLHGGDTFDLPTRIKWKRPEQFINQPVLFNEGISPEDVCQGFLGNCWFLSAVAALAERPQCLLKIFNTFQISPSGVYRLTLFKSGQQIKVTIDDLIPIKEHRPIFSKNNGNQIWVLLLQKAYAKLHGSYRALAEGFSNEALVDLTGAPAFRYSFENIEEVINSGEFCDWIQIWQMKDYCMIASTKSEVNRKKSGLIANHAYTIRKIAQYAEETLINLRNPWGRKAWKGDWSDRSEKWTSEAKRALDYYQNADDGTFWMKYQDFIRFFANVYVGKVGFPFEYRSRVMISNLPGTGGICSHCFFLEVEERTEVVIGLHQQDERSVGGHLRQYLDIGIIVLLVQGNEYSYVSSTNQNQTRRERQLQVQLSPGTYLVVAISSGCQFSNLYQKKEAPFRTESGELHPLFKSTIRDIYRRFDYNLNQTLSYQEFKEILDCVGIESSRQFYEEVVLRTYTSSDGGVTLQGLYEFFMLQTLDRGEKDMRMWMKSLGYDKSFNSVNSRALVLSIHSQKYLKINSVVDTDFEFNLQAWMHLSRNLGQLSVHGNTKVYLVKHRQGYSFTAQNMNERPVCIELDLRRSKNMNFSFKPEQMSDYIEGGACKIVQHMRIRERGKKMKLMYRYQISQT